MASERPKRSRRIVNYGEDHLHWIEESQLQKALLRSLNDKGSPIEKNVNESLVEDTSTNKDVVIEKRQTSPIKCTLISKSEDCNINDSPKSEPKLEDTYEPRLTRLQTKLLEEAGMYDPYPSTDASCNSEFNTYKHTDADLKTFTQKNLVCEEADASDVDDNVAASRVRAQRKFASNSSPSSSRNSSPVKMNKQKIHPDVMHKLTNHQKEKDLGQKRAVRASSSSSADIVNPNTNLKHKSKKRRLNANNLNSTKNYPASLFDRIPKTDTFLDYICFRNTTLKVELQDCLKESDINLFKNF